MNGNNQKSSPVVWIIIGLITVAVVFLIFKSTNAPERPPKTNREVAMICTTDMATQFHIHPNLKIIINGQAQELPTNIGISNSCMNPLHTHDDSGKIHVESPEKRDFTLADFFAVWKKTFTKDQILNYKVDETHTIRETVNGVETKDYENTVLYDGDQIIIYYEEKK
ncbi:MAG: hypothetical protein G01um101413_530 [Parcubacteria group bacterium Gr01-1014_13]|nr:MAG: hypothetical protein G01um101413_530 [Parcubacteria group bacterium Gr01-1014_13]